MGNTNRLTFNNCVTGVLNTPNYGSCASQEYGSYNRAVYSAVRELKNRYVGSGMPVSNPLDLNKVNTTPGTYDYNSNSGKVLSNLSNLTIEGTGGGDVVVEKGRTAIIVASGNVTIKSNIRYADVPLSEGLGAIPQVLIFAKNIYIDSQVERIDAWLITTGTGTDGRLRTCDVPNVNVIRGATQDNLDPVCSRRLQVNGPVMAGKVDLWRTAGSGTGRADDPGREYWGPG